MISIIIPSYNEPYLKKTVEDILKKAEGEIEIIVHLDKGDVLDIKDKRLIVYYPEKPKGMRAGINFGLRNSIGEYVMKVDAHCLFDQGFDKKLLEEMHDDWLVVPRRYSLNADGWKREKRMPIKDYHYLAWPQIYSNYGYCLFPQEWKERTYERMKGHDIDDTMTLQGSCWLANKNFFMKHVGFLDDDPKHYSTFSGEQLEVGLKYWLGGGQIKVNKKTWYAHLFKNKHYYEGRRKDRDYKKSLKTLAGWDWAAKHWMNNEEPGMIHQIGWLIDKFWPVPGWPENWRELWK